MGMFDNIEFDDLTQFEAFKIVAPFLDYEWQTKDFDCQLETYFVDSDGFIYRHKNVGLNVDYDECNRLSEKYDFHGVCYAYCYHVKEHYENMSTKIVDSAELKLTFTNGKLEKAELVSFEKDKKYEKTIYRNMVEHIKEIVNLDQVEAPKRFMVYGFDILCNDEKKWAITRSRCYYVNKNLEVVKDACYDFNDYFEAHDAIKVFFEKVKNGDYDTNEFLIVRPGE